MRTSLSFVVVLGMLTALAMPLVAGDIHEAVNAGDADLIADRETVRLQQRLPDPAELVHGVTAQGGQGLLRHLRSGS